MTKPCQGPDIDIKPPSYPIPAGAWDTHAHIFGPADQFPYAENRGYTPPDSPLEEYVRMLDRLQMARGVIVHGGAHGTDNRVTLNALRRLNGRCRGIAVVSPEIHTDELKEMHDLGVRGIRLSTVVKGGVSPTMMDSLAQKIKPFGWHILFHFNTPEELTELAPSLRNLPVGVMLDHLGRVPGDYGIGSQEYRTLIDLLTNTDHCWTKVSSWYRLSARDAFPYDDMKPIVQGVIAARPDRIVWGSNWPHPMYPGRIPNDGSLLDEFIEWVGDEQMLRQILVNNPEYLYGS